MNAELIAELSPAESAAAAKPMMPMTDHALRAIFGRPVAKSYYMRRRFLMLYMQPTRAL